MRLRPAALLLLAALASALRAAPAPATPAKPAPADDYPLKTCLVSDEPLSSGGDFVAYTHKEAGKPDVTVRLCCEGCIEDFRINPAKFLAKLDAARAARAKPAPAEKKKN